MNTVEHPHVLVVVRAEHKCCSALFMLTGQLGHPVSGTKVIFKPFRGCELLAAILLKAVYRSFSEVDKFDMP